MTVSPFSLEHDWSLNWNRLPSSVNAYPRIHIHKERERKALGSLATVGIIGKKQLSRLFHLSDKEIKKMEKHRKIIMHTLKQNNAVEIPIYSLGINAAKALKLDYYEPNYWVEYFASDVLRKLLFFQAYHFFSNLEIAPTPRPFVSAVENNGKLIYVYVVKGDVNDLGRYLKWNKSQNYRLMLIVESVEQLKPLEMFLAEMRVRVVIENDLMTYEKSSKDIFHHLSEGELAK